MLYQLFNADNGEPLQTVHDVQGLLWQPGDRVALRLNGKEALFRVTAVGPFHYEDDEIAAVARVKMLDTEGNPVPLGKPDSGGI